MADSYIDPSPANFQAFKDLPRDGRVVRKWFNLSHTVDSQLGTRKAKVRVVGRSVCVRACVRASGCWSWHAGGRTRGRGWAPVVSRG